MALGFPPNIMILLFISKLRPKLCRDDFFLSFTSLYFNKFYVSAKLTDLCFFNMLGGAGEVCLLSPCLSILLFMMVHKGLQRDSFACYKEPHMAAVGLIGVESCPFSAQVLLYCLTQMCSCNSTPKVCFSSPFLISPNVDAAKKNLLARQRTGRK